MKSADLKPGDWYAIKKGTAYWRHAEPGILLSDLTFARIYNKPGYQHAPKREPKSRFGQTSWGYPVAVFYNTKDAQQVDWADIEITPEQRTINGITVRVELHPSKNFVSSWHEELARQEAEGRAKTEAKRREAAQREHAAMVKTELAVLLDGISHLVDSQNGKVTVWDTDRLIELLRHQK